MTTLYVESLVRNCSFRMNTGQELKWEIDFLSHEGVNQNNLCNNRQYTFHL